MNMMRIRFNKNPVKKSRTFLIASIFVILFLSAYLGVVVVRGFQYTPDVYVCRHMSKDISYFLDGLGVDNKIVVGDSVLQDARHMWVAVNVLGFYVDIDSVYFYPVFNRFIHYEIEVFDSYYDYELSRI
jgi:hypothetical protein